MPQYWGNQTEISVGLTFVAGVIIQCIVAAVVVIFLSACAKRARNQHMLTGIILGVMAVPVILSSYVPVAGLSWVYNMLFVFTADFKIEAAICFVLVIVAYLMTRKEMAE